MSQRPALMPISTIVDLLTAQIEPLVRELLPQGSRHGHEWRCGSLAGEPGQSLAVNLGSRAGVWADFSSGESGDALDLVAGVCCGGDKTEAIKWARRWLGIEGGDPAEFERRRRVAEKKAAARKAEAEEKARQARESAVRIWMSASSELLGTPVDRYLAGRAIELARLPWLPGAIRYHPGLWNAETGQKWPAMVTSIIGPDGKQMSTHRTWLEVQRDGTVRKAPLAEPKKTLGGFRGGWISLWKGAIEGADGRLRKAAPISRVKGPIEIDITEGIEDGLSVVVSDPALRVIASVSGGNLANLRLPESAGLVLWAQNDQPGSDAAKAFAAAAAALGERHASVKVARPPAEYKDVNDMLIASKKLKEQRHG